MKKLNVLKKVIKDEFQDVNSENLFNLLGVLDDIHILFITQDIRGGEVLNNVLREYFFTLFKEKMKEE